MTNRIEAIQKISKLLRTPEDVLLELFDKMEKLTGKSGIAEKIYEENEKIVSQKLQQLGIDREKADTQFIEAAILKKASQADQTLYDYLDKPNNHEPASCGKMIETVKNISGVKTGFFLKEEKLKDFLFLNPPKNILSALGYANVQEMLTKENLYEIFAALRFVEDEKWLNSVFFRPYNDLNAAGFEERELRVGMLSEKWAVIGEKFVGKKLHHISHLKELGFIFVIPGKADNGAYRPGQTIETFSLILHYLHEVDFYSKLFRRCAQKPNFGTNLVRLLSGQFELVAPKGKFNWRILQRYLAKIDPQDPRLFDPHVNSETIHWMKAEKEIDKLAVEKNLKMEFWQGTDDFAGDIFPAGKRGEEIVSFDLLDNVVSLTHGGLEKYLYHQQEALWNKIFIEYLGEEKLEEMVVENIEKGFVELN